MEKTHLSNHFVKQITVSSYFNKQLQLTLTLPQTQGELIIAIIRLNHTDYQQYKTLSPGRSKRIKLFLDHSGQFSDQLLKRKSLILRNYYF